MKLSILVPFRDADGTRTRAKDWILARWAHFYPEAEIVVASDDGVDPFNKSLAVNNAAAQATGDIYAILDADSWVEERFVLTAIEHIEKRRAPWVVPIRRSMRLRQDVSERIMATDPTGPLPRLAGRDAENGITPIVGFLWIVPRKAFEAVNGMDDRIRGWGGEDTSFVRAMTVVNGAPIRLPGTVMCLWHDRPRDRNKNRVWVGQDRSREQDKAAVIRQYNLARGREAMLKVVKR
jgi:hypothetical protein